MKDIEAVKDFQPGRVLCGRWERNSYRIIRSLGRGGSGQVFLVSDEAGTLLAMKISTDLVGITHEHRILRFLNHQEEIKRLGIVPKVYELDDFQIGCTVYHYIISQYCCGVNLSKHCGRLNYFEAATIGQRIARFLSCLHQTGLIFGDLKPSNLIYDFKNRHVFLIDYGSVCYKGHGLKQYTPGYDRASWQAGTRTADEAYDIFGLGMLLVTLLLGKNPSRTACGLKELIARISRQIRQPLLLQTVTGALLQNISDSDILAMNFSRIVKETTQPAAASRLAGVFVNLVGVASMAAFILSLFYYYQ